MGECVGNSEGRHTGTYVGFACVHTALHMFGKGCGCHLHGSRARRGAVWLALWRPSSRSASDTPRSPVATGGAMVARRDVRHRRPIIAASLRIATPSACHWHAARDRRQHAGVCEKLIPMATRRDKDYKLAARWPGNVTPKPIRPDDRGWSRGVRLSVTTAWWQHQGS